MSKSILIALVLALTVTACGGSCKAYTDRVQEQKQEKDTTCGNYMTNDEIIATTKQCEDAGLDAEALHCGDDHQTVTVQCKPRSKSE